VACRLALDGLDNSPLVLEQPGISQVRLRFSPTDEVTSGEVLVAIGLQSSLRAYLPALGAAHVDLLVNGEPAGTISTAFINTREHHLYLYSSRLRRGENDLVLRLRDDSETSLRVHWVEVWPWPPP
jgi:hypothetical protein